MKKFIEDPNHTFAKDTAHGVGSLWGQGGDWCIKELVHIKQMRNHILGEIGSCCQKRIQVVDKKKLRRILRYWTEIRGKCKSMCIYILYTQTEIVECVHICAY